jgi:hypothetical protein
MITSRAVVQRCSYELDGHPYDLYAEALDALAKGGMNVTLE